MEFYVDDKYSAFEELMYYYHFDFCVYYLLALIVLVNCIKAIINFSFIKKRKTSNISSSNTDLLVSILAGIGLGCGMFFQGALSDISHKYSEIWGRKIFILCIIAFVLFIIQFIFIQKSKNIKNKINEEQL